MSEEHSIAGMSDEAFGWYFSGLADGEGCFAFSSPKSQRRRFIPHFTISLRADDGVGLRAISDRLGVGVLRACNKHKPGGSRNSNPQVRWGVYKLGDLANVIVPQFDRYPLQLKKARDFAIWRECIILLHEISLRPWRRRPGRRAGALPKFTPEEHAKLTEWRIRLQEGRKYREPSKEELGLAEVPW